MTNDAEEFSATQRDTGDDAPGATAVFPYDRMTVEGTVNLLGLKPLREHAKGDSAAEFRRQQQPR